MAFSPVLGTPDDLTLDASTPNVTRIDCPTGARFLRIRGRAVEVYLQTSGVDGAARGADYETIAATATTVRRLPGTGEGRSRNLNGPVVYLSCDTNSGVVEITAMAEGS